MTQTLIPESLYEQERQLARVNGKIGLEVYRFCLSRLGQQFHASDLHAPVSGVTAPASADRILRLMRTRGIVSYKVLNRAKSLYQVTQVKGASDAVHS